MIPLFQQLNQIPRNSSLKQLISSFKNSSNPQQFLNNYIKNNPQIQNIYSMIQNSNKSPKELFYQIAQEKGIDPSIILNMFNDN